jgi:sulfotransferase 6B1
MHIPEKSMKLVANSRPKSGTHLLTRVFDLLGYKHGYYLMGSLARTDSTRNPIKKLMILSRLDPNGISVDMDDLSLRINPQWITKKIRQQSDYRYYPAHLPYSSELEELLVQQNVKIFSIVRDPRDVAISYTNHMLKEKQYLHSLFTKLPDTKTRIKYVLSGCSDREYTLAPLRDRIERTIGWHRSSLVCSLKFENLVGRQGGGEEKTQLDELKRILDYLDIHLEASGIEDLADEVFYTKSRTFHRGQMNQWQNLFTDDLKDYFKRECGEALISLGYEKDNNW